jgi:hypothetical protein
MTNNSYDKITKNGMCRECGVEGKWILGCGGETTGKERTWKTVLVGRIILKYVLKNGIGDADVDCGGSG